MKKALVATLVYAASAFAAWDYFPVIEHGKGEAKAGFIQGRQGNQGWGPDLETFKLRYSPLENLELLSQIGYTLGVRYQIIPVLSAGFDIGFPIPNTAWIFTPNAQFSMSLTDALSLGSNVQVTIITENPAKNNEGINLSTGVELDLAIGKSIVWVACDVNTGLTDRRQNDGGLEIVPKLGYVAVLGNLSLGTNVGWAFGKDAGHDNFATFIGLDFSVKF